MPPAKPSRRKSNPAVPPLKPPSAFEKAMHDLKHHPPTAFPNISPRWLAGAVAVAFLAALLCGWLALCLLYWQGSWQLLYHPSPAITRTPANAGLSSQPIRFATTETGATQLTGWWIPAPDPQRTILYLHGADGNLSSTIDTLAILHNAGLAVFAVDYRGYGQSILARPSEKQLRQDAEWALTWLTLTRQIPPKNIVLCGTGLGANLAAELAADHSELAGIILDQPLQDAMAPVFNDPRSRLVPAHWLVHDLIHDRYDLTAAAQSIKIPSLWLLETNQPAANPQAYELVPAQKTRVWLKAPISTDSHSTQAIQRWLDDL
jgi:uncharacterized protein